jgi:hypothetical protein
VNGGLAVLAVAGGGVLTGRGGGSAGLAAADHLEQMLVFLDRDLACSEAAVENLRRRQRRRRARRRLGRGDRSGVLAPASRPLRRR